MLQKSISKRAIIEEIRMSVRKKLLNLLENRCEICGSIENLEIHHKDRHPRHNELSNLQLLCRVCHRSIFHSWGKKRKRNRKKFDESMSHVVKTVKIQPRRTTGFMVTLPISMVRGLGLEDNEQLDVFVDYEKKEVIYKLREQSSSE